MDSFLNERGRINDILCALFEQQCLINLFAKLATFPKGGLPR